MLKPLYMCLSVLLVVSCATSEYDRELEKKRAEQLKGVKFPPVTVIDCYNILALRHDVEGKIILNNKTPEIIFKDCYVGKIIQYKPDKNIITCFYTTECADPVPRVTVSLLMLVSSDKNIYVLCRMYYDMAQCTPCDSYYLYKDRLFWQVEPSVVPADVKDKVLQTK